MNESKSDKFARLARARLDKVRNDMRLIRNLTGSAYEYTKDDVNWLSRELNTMFDEVLACFDKPKG